ncbi:uroporphyrinogen decarboxylase family protein [bacterium]
MRYEAAHMLIDGVIDLVENSPAGDMIAQAVDAPLAALEKMMGLGEDAKKVHYGNNPSEYKSLILGYFKFLKEKIESGESDTGHDDGEEQQHDGGFITERHGSEKRAQKPGAFIQRVKELGLSAKEASQNQPKILEGDRLTPKERVKRHINFESADRVAIAPLAGFNIANAGGITVREFMTDGEMAARACRKFWDIHGGFDMLPVDFPAGYLFPIVPETHSRFCSKWVLPLENELPKMEEIPILPDYDDILEDGIIGMTRTESGRLLKEFRRAALQMLIYGARMAIYFPRMDLYHTYAAGVVNHPADLLSMWKGFENFMIDCAMDPLKVREACEMLAPGLVEFGIFTASLSGSDHLLYGASRISGSWISGKMFDDLFAGTFRDQAWQLHDNGFGITYHLDNDYTPILDFFLELPEKSGMLHLDQTDMFRAKEKLHGHLCLMGNLHPGISAAGTPEDVEATCEKLIKEVGAGGGFILSSACEVPIDAPVENLQAMKRAVDKWGWY